jgi:superfamily II DNA or RNA helicase
MSFQLRDYQLEIIEKARQKMREGCKRFLITSPTGSGKTCLTAHMLKTAASKGMDSLFLVHRRELIKQSSNTFGAVNVRHGIISAGFRPDYVPHVQIGSIGTVGNRIHKIKKPTLIIWDECHHIASNSWTKIFHAFPDAFHVGLTATPERLDGKGLGKYFEHMIRGPEVEWLIDEGYLCKYVIYAPPGPSMENVKIRMGDFSKKEVNEAYLTPQILGDSVKLYRKHIDGKRAIVFSPSIEYSENLILAFNADGVRARHVDGESEEELRDGAIRSFKEDELKILSNVGLFGEGFDVPALDSVIDSSPTMSLSAYLQRFGRCLRPMYAPGMPLETREQRFAAIAAGPKPFAVYLDQAGNVLRHGLPDEFRDWDLEGRKGRDAKKQSAPIKTCGQCYAVNHAAAVFCKQCGFQFRTEGRAIEKVDGDLVKVDVDELRRARLREQGSARSEEALIALGRQRGYKRPEAWARHMMIARANARSKKLGA